MRLVSAVLALEAEEGSEEAEDCSQQTPGHIRTHQDGAVRPVNPE